MRAHGSAPSLRPASQGLAVLDADNGAGWDLACQLVQLNPSDRWAILYGVASVLLWSEAVILACLGVFEVQLNPSDRCAELSRGLCVCKARRGCCLQWAQGLRGGHVWPGRQLAALQAGCAQ